MIFFYKRVSACFNNNIFIAFLGVSFVLMNELRLNSFHDIELSGNRISRILKTDADAPRKEAEQQCLCLLRCEEGESFIDYTHGVPWFKRILGLPAQHLDVATAIIRKKLSQLPTVKKVFKIALKVKGRNVGGEFKVQAKDGSVTTGDF